MTFRHTGTPIIVHSRTFKKSFCISSSATTKLWNIVSRSFDNKKFDFCIPFHPLIHLQFSNRRDNTHTQLTGEIKQSFRDRGGCDRMVVGFTITYVISAYHHWCCEFESRSEREPGFVNYKKGALDSQPQVIKFASCMPMIGGPVVLSGYSGFFHHYNWSPWYSWNIVGSRLASILHTRLKAYRLSELNLFLY